MRPWTRAATRGGCSRMIPLGRCGTIGEVASAVVYFDVDGGCKAAGEHI